MTQIRFQFSGGPRNGTTELIKGDNIPRVIEVSDAAGCPNTEGSYLFRHNDSTLATANFKWIESSRSTNQSSQA